MQLIMQLFAPKNMKKLHSKVAHNQPKYFFNIANRPKKSSNLNFCSIKIARRLTYVICIMTLIKTKTFLFCLKDAESIQQHSVVRISCAWFYLFIICLSDLSSTGFEIDQTSRSDIGPLHVLWQVSFGCWVTWSISSWQKYYKSVFFPKDEWLIAELLFLSLYNWGLNFL